MSGRTVSRDLYDVAVADRRAWEEKYHALAMQMIEMKRHDFGMHAPGFDPATLDPFNSVGPKTQLAVDQASQGDPELHRYNRAQALLLWNAHEQAEGRDELVASLILAGDTE